MVSFNLVPPLSPSVAPRRVARYMLYEAFASGGMATVHFGRLVGDGGFARTVAIKRLRPTLSGDPDFVAMFLDEAHIAARVRHPNVVPILDVVSLDGELFLVMDYVHGESLSRLLHAEQERDRRVMHEIVASIMVDVLHGLHASHETRNERGELLGIVHRDVSPQNVIIGTDGVARVLDFGIAKALGRAQSTREGELKGKFAYMAPEQFNGGATRQTDIYACGAVLWEALVGRRLFQGETDAEIALKVLTRPIDPPSHHETDIPERLDEIVMTALQPNPVSRFATARDMAEALESAIPLASAIRVGEWVERCATESLSARVRRVAEIELSVPLTPPHELPLFTRPDNESTVASRVLPAYGSDVVSFAPAASAASTRNVASVLSRIAALAVGLLGSFAAVAAIRSASPPPDRVTPSLDVPDEAVTSLDVDASSAIPTIDSTMAGATTTDSTRTDVTAADSLSNAPFPSPLSVATVDGSARPLPTSKPRPPSRETPSLKELLDGRK